ncbi:MAG TPA: FAD-dependent monooxygenase [Streptosporangiaceae bacterium]|nr:FAD-dependent monooxygenase [Streptosporangiaceae bacterium]
MTARSTQVIIVGAGATGLALAGELALAGVSCQVIERRAARTRDSRANCLHARSMETLDLRGQAAAYTDVGTPISTLPLGLEGTGVDLRRLDSDFPYVLNIRAHRVEDLLEAWATRLGAEVVRSAAVLGVEQDEEEVRVTVAGPDGRRVERAAYVVGCDGSRSTVREAVGLAFPGAGAATGAPGDQDAGAGADTDAVPVPGSVIVADVRLTGLPADEAYGGLTDAGMAFAFPFDDGTCRVVLYDYGRTPARRPADEPVTLEEIRAGLARSTGRTDLDPRDLGWSARFSGTSRQAPAYRMGRVFLAGRAALAHVPVGAQDLDSGLADAINLGWKLAATLHGWAPNRLLDSYHDERHPAGRDVLARTARQFWINAARTTRHRLLRWLAYRVVVPLPPVQSRLAGAYSGLSARYPPAGKRAHPLAGTRLPRGTLTLPGGSRTRLYDLFADGRFVLLDHDFHAERYGGLPRHVRTVPYLSCDRRRWPAAVLVRPDGYIAWAHDEADAALRAPMAHQAVQSWCSSVISRTG